MSAGPSAGSSKPAGEAAGLYLHVPFCSAICPYCDFAVRRGRRDKRRRFVDTLRREIDRYRLPERTKARQKVVPAGGGSFVAVDTIYFGGGTPSLLEPEDLERLLDDLRRTFRPLPDTRVYLEANPEDVTAESLETWRRLGIGILSLGVQSFDDDELRFLGRRHDAAVARHSVELASAAGFDTLSVDLIYGLPGRSAVAWRRNLELATALEPDHLSCYELVIHERTTFGKRRARGELTELAEGDQAELFLFTRRALGDAGYDGYEVSNFARAPEHRSRHNRKYWRHVPYLGFGPSAHSFDGRRRWWNQRLLARWERAVRAGEEPVAGEEILDRGDLALETVMLGLRTAAGVDLERFEQRFGYDLAERNRQLVARLIADRLLRHERWRLAPTAEGLAVAEGLAAAFDVG